MTEERRLLAAVVIFIATMCLAAALLGGCTGGAEVTEDAELGQPLDAVRYPTPAFADGGHPTWRVVDRQSHQAWWMVWMHDRYVVLPIGEELNGDE